MKKNTNKNIETFQELVNSSDYSFIEKLNSDPDAKFNGDNKLSREVFSGHYVPVSPTAIKEPIYISHSVNFFKELGFSESLIKSNDFIKELIAEFKLIVEPYFEIYDFIIKEPQQNTADKPNKGKQKKYKNTLPLLHPKPKL